MLFSLHEEYYEMVLSLLCVCVCVCVLGGGLDLHMFMGDRES